MHIDQYTKEQQKGYCRTVLATQGKLTKALFDKINAGDEATLLKIYEDQQDAIRKSAESIEDEEDRKVTLTQIDSIQEVLDCLNEILNT